MVWLEEKGREALLAGIKLETQAAGATVIIAGHKTNETTEMFGFGLSGIYVNRGLLSIALSISFDSSYKESMRKLSEKQKWLSGRGSRAQTLAPGSNKLDQGKSVCASLCCTRVQNCVLPKRGEGAVWGSIQVF